MQCPHCKAPVHVIALIEDADVIDRILKHLGIWAPCQEAAQVARPPPRGDAVEGASERAELPPGT